MSENYTLINWQNGEITQPAVVEIDGVDYQVQPAIETGNTPINADNLNHMDNGIRNATLKLNDKIETATVQLIAVTDTAPSECAENDKYYNTNTNLIYTATGTDTWGVTGETPSQLYLYMDISDEKLYYYDGNTFSSYGGGSGGTGGETLPIGSIMLYSGNVLPVNWLLCNGQAISRTKYSALFEKIGTTYGSGDGSTTFNVPNLKGRVAVGKDDNDTNFDTLGETGGEKTHTHSLEDGYAKIDVSENTRPYWKEKIVDQYAVDKEGSSGNINKNNSSTTVGAAVELGGNTDTKSNLQPYIVQNFIIKAEQAPGTATLAEALPVGSQIGFDGDVSDIPTGWQQVDNPNEYSETEIVIGTYEGKPHYRKIIKVNNPPKDTDNSLSFSSLSIEKITDIGGMAYNGTSQSFPVNFFASGSAYIYAHVDYDNSRLKYRNSNWNLSKIEFILEYTKTTDTI